MNRRLAQLGLLLLLLLIAPLSSPAQEQDPRLKEIDGYARKAIQDWRVPGFAIAIVKDDKVIFERGYGVRKLGETAPVDERTLFAVASNTKAFTAALLGILVDEGKIKWDDPVTKYLPGFQLYDLYSSREMTIRDLLSHRSGLATFGGDLLWYETTYDSKEVVRRIRFLNPTSSFRSRYGYQNIMFILSNSETSLPNIMMNKVFDVFLGLPKRDWSAELLERVKQGKESAKKAGLEEDAARLKDTKPSLALSQYAGSYGGLMYGEGKISEENGKLVLRLVPAPNLVADLIHWQYDTFQVKWRDSVSYAFGRGFVTFVLNAQGKVDEMKIDVPNPDFDFEELEFKRSK